MRGDHVVVDRAGVVYHGIDVGDGRIICCEESSGQDGGDRIIRYAALEEFVHGYHAEVREHDERLSVEETVERAQSRLGEHCPGRDHGEGFALWCVSGRTADRLAGGTSSAAPGTPGPDITPLTGFVPGVPRSLLGAGDTAANAHAPGHLPLDQLDLSPQGLADAPASQEDPDSIVLIGIPD